MTDRVLVVLMMCFFVVGYIGHLIPVTLDLMLLLTPIFLLGMGILVLYPFIRKKDIPLLVWALVMYILTFTIEALGVWTGAVFGEYEYGPTLGPGLFGVPLVIGFNWVMVVMGAMELSMFIVRDRRICPVIAGALATLFDVVLEPVAIELDYWTWEGGSIPVQNYVAWFIIATLMATTYPFVRRDGVSKPLIVYLMLQTVLFLLIRAFIVGG
ncbi:MAG: carotenoid biosynthesis protein [Candidatus Thermoplasmatota archaeon]|nr:carotenoid biosynthesis protein [Candidatus Thermoplasmatota archaeon]